MHRLEGIFYCFTFIQITYKYVKSLYQYNMEIYETFAFGIFIFIGQTPNIWYHTLNAAPKRVAEILSFIS